MWQKDQRVTGGSPKREKIVQEKNYPFFTPLLEQFVVGVGGGGDLPGAPGNPSPIVFVSASCAQVLFWGPYAYCSKSA